MAVWVGALAAAGWPTNYWGNKMRDYLTFRDVVSDQSPNLLVQGFSERQARFLATVMAHSGVFVERQYCRFAGVAHGQKSHDFIRRLVDAGFVRDERPGPTASGPPLSRAPQAPLHPHRAGQQPSPKACAAQPDDREIGRAHV